MGYNKHDCAATVASRDGVSRRGRVAVRFTDAVPPWIVEYLVVTKKTRIKNANSSTRKIWYLMYLLLLIIF